MNENEMIITSILDRRE